MNTTVLMELVPGTLPGGLDYCWTSWQQLNVDIVSRIQANLVTEGPVVFYNLGSTTPTPDNRTWPWFNTTDLRWYYYTGGFWCSPHPLTAGSKFIAMYDGTNDAAGLWILDGGDGTDPNVPGNVGDTKGSFWIAVDAMAARVPLGAGTLPSSTVVNPTSTGGEEKHTLLSSEMPPHTHGFTVEAHAPTDDGTGYLVGGDSYQSSPDGTYAGTTSNAGGDTSTPPVTLPHNTLPPYYGVYFIKRTARKYLTIPG